MRKPAIADTAPTSPSVTAYDENHFPLYLQILDALQENVAAEDICRTILGRDPQTDPHCMAVLESHINRAKWMSEQGYKDLLASRQ